jgi:hypothetical protein
VPRARKYETNAQRQAAYRARKEAALVHTAPPVFQAITQRVLKDFEKARERELGA